MIADRFRLPGFVFRFRGSGPFGLLGRPFGDLGRFGLGGDGVRVRTRKELKAALDRAIATRGRFQLIEVMIPRGVLSKTLERYVAGVKRLTAK